MKGEPGGIAQHVPSMPIHERDRRWAEARVRMRDEGLDALIVTANDAFFGTGTANLRYLTQIGTAHGGVCVFPVEGDPVVLNSPPHMNQPFNWHAAAYDWVADIRPYEGIPSVVSVLGELGLQQERLGIVSFGNAIVPDTLFHRAVVALETELPRAHLLERTPLVERLRLIKSPTEIEMLEKASEIALATIQRLYDEAVPGVRENELLAAMTHEQLVRGADHQTFNLMTSGPVSDDGRRFHMLHGVEMQTTRPIDRGDVVITEFHVAYAGYMSAAQYSVAVGPVPAPLGRIHEVCVETQAVYEEVMRPGVALRDAWRAIREPVRRAGMDYIELGFHGHGLASPEWPTVVYPEGQAPLDGAGLEDVLLEENMVFGCNIDIHDPSWSTGVGLSFGDMVQVTPGGGRLMVGVPTDQFQKAV